MDKEQFNEQLPEGQLQQEPAEEAVEEIVEETVEEVTEEIAEETAEDTAEEVAEEAEEEATEDKAEPVIPEIPQMPAQKSKAGMIVVISLLSVALVAALALIVLMGAGIVSFNKPTEPETTVQETTEPINLKSYTVDTETAIAKAGDVVATAGESELTNGELHVYYWMGVYDFISANSMYLAYMGVDFSQPLDQQVYDAEEGTSWQEAMIENALLTWHQYSALGQAGREAGYELDEEGQEYMAQIETNIQEMLEATGFETLNEMLASEMGPGATAEGYRNFMTNGYYAVRYFNDAYEKLLPTVEQIEQYYAENEETLTEAGITKDAGDVVDVRHILIKPEGGTTAEDGSVTYSEEEWETCRQKAQDLLDQWKAGEATEDAFAELAEEHTQDPGSKDNGGLYEKVTEGYMVTEFNDWIFDETRLAGDTDLVKTVHGYHIMYFVEREEGWISQTRDHYMNEKASQIMNGALTKWPLQTDYDAIGLSEPEAKG